MKLSFLFITALCMVLSALGDQSSPSVEQQWNDYKIKYGKKYATKEEEQLRKNIFFDNRGIIISHNNIFERNNKTYQLGINKFSDLTLTEFKKYIYGSQPQASAYSFAAVNLEELPNGVNWIDEGAVTPVQNELECHSSWAFSAVGSIEGALFKKTNKLVPLSAQNLVDCSKKQGNTGCTGGSANNAFQYVIDNKGIDTAASYPYIGEESISCKYNSATVGATVYSFNNVVSGDEKSLASAVSSFGPIAAGIDGSHLSFKSYRSGIYYEPSCSSTNVNHYVLIVGYGTQNGEDYWLVKNSWGTGWGMDGYIKMARNRNNNCGIATNASYPILN